MPVMTSDDIVAAGGDTVARAANARVIATLQLFDDAASFDFYLHPLGNDLDHGRTKGAPFRNMSAAIAAAGSQSGVRIGVGAQTGALSDYRGQNNRIPGASLSGLTVGRWGQGTRPRFIGATRITTAWTAGTNGEYYTPLAYTPVNVFRQIASTAAAPVGLVTKLYPTTAAPGAVPVGRWVVNGGNLYINIGSDPTPDYIEVTDNIANPTTNALANCLYPAAGTIVQDIDIMMWPGSGGICGASDVTYQRMEVSYVGNDGLDFSDKCKRISIKDTVFRRVGTTRGVDNGPGDAISFHRNAEGLVETCSFFDCDRSGVGNQASSKVRTTRSYFEGCYRNWAVYGANDGDGTIGQHDLDYCIFRRSQNDETLATVLDGSGLEVNGKIHNNTLFNPATQNAMSVMLGISRGNFEERNNILQSSTQSVSGVAQYGAAVVTSDYSTILGFNTTYQSGQRPSVTGPNIINSGTVGFVSGANRNYGLQSTSISRGTGTALGYTKDFFGNPVPATNPDRGAVQRL